jgi:archaellum biogenesis ATPase FlaH
MQEYKILRAMGSSRKHFESVRRFVDASILSPRGVNVLREIDEYYDADDSASAVDWEIVRDRLLRSVQSVPKHKEEFNEYLNTLINLTDVSEVNVVREVKDTLLDKHALAMADAVFAGDRKELDRTLDQYLLVRDHDDLNLEVEERYTGLSIAELASHFEEGNRIRIGPALLTHHLGGGLRRGHHLLLAARPEVGKSMFALNMAGAVLRQGYKVLYVGNEDPVVDLMMRLVSNLSGMTEEQLMHDPDTGMELACANGYERATFVGMAPGSVEAIGAVCRNVEPDVLIIDQLRNLSANTENNTQRLDVVARGARNLGRQHDCAVISVTQAGDSAEGKLVLNMGDVDGSNTGIPGACDVMVMVGCNDEYYRNNWRVLTLPKNKIGRYHGHFTVEVQPELTRVVSSKQPAAPTQQEF